MKFLWLMSKPNVQWFRFILMLFYSTKLYRRWNQGLLKLLWTFLVTWTSWNRLLVKVEVWKINVLYGSIQSAHYRKQKQAKIKRNCLETLFLSATPSAAKKDHSGVDKLMADKPRSATSQIRVFNFFYKNLSSSNKTNTGSLI